MNLKASNLNLAGGNDESDPIDIHVGKRLHQRRKIMGLSQGQLADALDLTFQQIQKYERATNRISASRLFRLARMLNVTVQYFYDEMPSEILKPQNIGFAESGQAPLEGAPSFDDEILRRRETMELLRAYYNIADDEQRKKMFQLIKSMSKKSSE